MTGHPAPVAPVALPARPGRVQHGRVRPGALTVAVSVLAIVAGCAADRPDPAPLEDYAPKISGRQVWRYAVGRLRSPLQATAHDGAFVAADSDGSVLALAADDGRLLWRGNVGARIAAGVGSDGRFASIVTEGNEVVTLDGGRELWRKRVPAAAVTPPLVAGERVFVMTVDRVVHAFDAIDGRRLWVFQKPGDALTLAQPGLLTAYRNALLAGQGARLAALDPLDGKEQWDVPVATPRGTNEVERLADLLGPAVRNGSRFCARAFQSAVGCVDAARGTVLWSRNAGGVAPVGGDAERVFGADASDRITAWRADNGDIVWTSEKLLHRGLSGPLAAGPNVLFGDREGYVHFLAAASGEQQLRLATDGSPVVGIPVVAGGTVVVTTRDGGIFAFRAN